MSGRSTKVTNTAGKDYLVALGYKVDPTSHARTEVVELVSDGATVAIRGPSSDQAIQVTAAQTASIAADFRSMAAALPGDVEEGATTATSTASGLHPLTDGPQSFNCRHATAIRYLFGSAAILVAGGATVCVGASLLAAAGAPIPLCFIGTLAAEGTVLSVAEHFVCTNPAPSTPAPSK